MSDRYGALGLRRQGRRQGGSGGTIGIHHLGGFFKRIGDFLAAKETEGSESFGNMRRKRKSLGDSLCVTDSNPREVKAEMRSSSFSLQEPPGWHPGEEGPPGWRHREEGPLRRHPEEAASRGSNLNLRGNGLNSLKSVGALRTRESKFSPNPNHFPRNPPGFNDSINESRFSSNPSHSATVPGNPPGFDKSNIFHGVKMIFQESLEITSDRPFLPQRRAPPGGSNISSASDQVPRDKQGRFGGSRSPLTSVAADAFNAVELAEGGPRKSSSTGKRKKKKQPSANDGQAAHAGTIVLASSFEKETPPALRPGILGERPSILGEPPGLPSGDAMLPKSTIVDISSESASDVCLKLWKDLGLAMQKRERVLRERERSLTQNSINKQALEEEFKQATALKDEVMEERRRLEEEEQRIRTEKDAMKRTSTDIAVQRAELEQVQKQIEKEKAAILALKSELGVRKRSSQKEELVEATIHVPVGAVKAEIENSISNPSINCSHVINFSSESGITARNRQVRESDIEMDFPAISKTSAMANDRNWESVEAEPVTSGWDAIHEYISEDDINDVPLATRLKKRRVEKAGAPSRSSEEIKHADSNVESSTRRAGSQSVGCKSQAYDVHMKRNKVPIEVALQEDAPGLLEQLLEERGLLDDMAVYQDMEMDDSLAMEGSGSEFGVLEGVIGKLWGPNVGLGKDLLPVKGQASGNMPRYCLACLFSLIEQTKSLRKRKWPVEWGWSRRLRAFLFVFEKHNRIVLERPEYGYATYFFELVQKLPIKWQVQRLITVMSVATTGRAALLENRQLEVGLHLTNDEASILEDYGWNPSSGLGSLLNFCERVVHDYNKGQEDLGNDWKQKIGKLLMDGYDHGSIVQSIPRKLRKALGDNLSDNLSDTDSFSGSQVKAEPA